MKDDLIYRLIKLAVNLLALLPRQILSFFSDLSGLLWFHLDKRHRDITLENIKFAYPGKFSADQARRFIKNVFKNFTSIPFEVIWSYRKSRDELFKYFTIKGLRHLEDAIEKGRGVLLLTGHIGNFELLVESVAKSGIKPYGVYRKLDFAPLERLVLEIRQRFGATMIPLRGASKKIDAILQNGGIMATLLDQNVDWYKGVFVNYFGRPACTNSGFAKLALKSKAIVIPMFIKKMNHHYVMEFLPEVPLQVTGDSIKDIENNTQNYVSAIESMVRQCPEQYFWVHRRWKTRPYSTLNTY